MFSPYVGSKANVFVVVCIKSPSRDKRRKKFLVVFLCRVVLTDR